jgi:membrane-associated phospholipid phosphatase
MRRPADGPDRDVPMLVWHVIVVAYFTYLALLSLFVDMRPGPWRRAPIAACVALPALELSTLPQGDARVTLAIVVPALFLVTGYWLSGLFFTRPMIRVERALLEGDRWLLPRLGLHRFGARGPRLVLEGLELSYLLVYAMVPAGAVVLAVAGRGQDLPRYWAVVLGATLASYAMLPWLQTRPPRAVEPDDPFNGRTPWFRRANLAVLVRGSHHANTVPSGHAAGAFATALAVGAVLPGAGVAFLVLAVAIAVATVVGRYHYAIDTILGVAVAVAAWAVLG